MIKHIKVKDFKAIPYLQSSLLMQSHPNGIKFSTKKPNVIVGPNGAGKSALLTTLSLFTLTHFTGETSFDDHYINGRDADDYWEQVGRSWSKEYAYLPGLDCESDFAPALYYRPGQIPGNEKDITYAMMTGYCNEARAYGELVKNKSSGQKSQAILKKLIDLLKSDDVSLAPKYVNWRYNNKLIDLNALDDGKRRFLMKYDYYAEVLKSTYATPDSSAVPVVLMDEPEQSLDAKAQAMLWRMIEKSNPANVQVIIATHSLYPLLHPEAFNLIEAVPGYINEVKELIGN